jgi:peroxiredoxin (alkyl hydroperoxide reductase subunit C)
MIGERAPEFEAETTNGHIKFPSQYKGRWVILFSHPADFTPVCTTEFMMFGSRYEEFKRLNCDLVGLSVDSVSAHIAWLRSIKNLEFCGIKDLDIKFPVIDDVKMCVAKAYGMISPNVSDTKTVRAVFFIDPHGIIRCIHYYPLTTGRNVEEMIRVIQALQKADSDKVATPVNWTPGDGVIVPVTMTMNSVKERVDRPGDLKNIDWFLSLKDGR